MAYRSTEFGPDSLLAPTYGVQLDESGKCLANIGMTEAQRPTLSVDNTVYGAREIRSHRWVIGEATWAGRLSPKLTLVDRKGTLRTMLGYTRKQFRDTQRIRSHDHSKLNRN